MIRMKSAFRIILMAVFLLCPTQLVSAQLSVTTPAFAMTGIETTVIIEGLAHDDHQPVHYRVEIDESPVLSGVSVQSDLHEMKVVFPNPGSKKLSITIGSQNTETKIRVISGWLSILPPLIAIALALFTHEVISSLFLGIWFGATLIYDFNVFTAFFRTVDKHLIEVFINPDHASIMIFSLSLGGMVGVINKTGGMHGIVELLSKLVKGPRTAQFCTWLMGVLIFFDDYANTLIVGNSMRPLTDKNKISREKLSYLVDSTAAPVAGIAVLSTWIGYEIGLIRQAYVNLGIIESNFYGIFLQTLPFRFYCLLALFFGFLVSVSRRDFGPMLAAEERATNEGKLIADDANPISSPESAMPDLPENMPKRWYNAAIPIAIVVFGTFLGLLGDGDMFLPHFDLTTASTQLLENSTNFTVSAIEIDNNIIIGSTAQHQVVKLHYSPDLIFDSETRVQSLEKIEALKEGDSINILTSESTLSFNSKARSAFGAGRSMKVLIWMSIIGSLFAIFLGWAQGLIKINSGIKAWMGGARTLVAAICLMLLAWTISGICVELKTADYIIAMVTDMIPYWLLPTIIFIIACLVAFATGSSWGTMAILIPISIPLAYDLNMKHYQDVIAGTPGAPEMMIYVKQMLLVSIGAVLEGSIFGDHCSPLSDTTIMSSMASGSDHIDHVKTQAPYAAVVALAAILFCYIPAGMGFSPMILIPLSMFILSAFLFTFGREAVKEDDKLHKTA